LEENVHVDQYVPVMVVDRNRKLNIERRASAVFYSAEEAMAYARKLRDTLKVRTIKLFHWENN